MQTLLPLLFAAGMLRRLINPLGVARYLRQGSSSTEKSVSSGADADAAGNEGRTADTATATAAWTAIAATSGQARLAAPTGGLYAAR